MKTHSLHLPLLLIAVFCLSLSPVVFAQNVGIGTENPGQKLEVAGNIKLGDNVMVEGDSDYKVYRNLASYSVPGNDTGAFVVRTNQPMEVMWTMTIKGQMYFTSDIFEITVGGYRNLININYLNESDYNPRVRVGLDGDSLVVILGETTDNHSYPMVTVTEFRQGYSNMLEEYADGWSVTQETNLAAFGSLTEATQTNDLQWIENGSNIYYTAGNVGIGTTNPAQKLDINNGNIMVSNPQAYLYLNGTNTSTGAGIISFLDGSVLKKSIYYDNDSDKLLFYDNSTYNYDMAITSDGKIGIGTTSPLFDLHVSKNEGTTNTTNIYANNNYTGTAGSISAIKGQVQSTATTNPGAGIIGIHNSTAGNSAGIRGESYSSTGRGVYGWAYHSTGVNYGLYGKTESSNGFAGYFVGGKNYFEGNVGIGTTTPTEKLHITAGNIKIGHTDPSIYFEGSTGNSSLVFRENGTNKKAFYYSNALDKLILYDYTRAAYDIGITSAGDMGIGTINPSSRFHIKHPSGTWEGFTLQNETDSDEWRYYVYSTNALTLYFNGYHRGSWDDVTGVYSSSSDLRLKKDIASLQPVLKNVMQLKPSEYRFLIQDDNSPKNIGFIAQEVMDKFPSLVHYQDESDLYMLDYSGFGVVAIKAIQEQQQIIDNQQQQIDDIAGKMELLMQKIEALGE